MVSISNNYFVEVDRFCDRYPCLSTVNNLVALFYKCVVLPCKSQKAVEANHYYTHLQQKSFSLCIALLIPVLGQLFAYLYNRQVSKEQKAIENHPEVLESAKLAVQDNGLALEQMSDEIKDTKEIVELAIENHPEAFRFASERLRNDPDLAIKAIKRSFEPDFEREQTSKIAQYLGSELNKDPEGIFQIYQVDAAVMSSMDESLKNNEAFRNRLLLSDLPKQEPTELA